MKDFIDDLIEYLKDKFANDTDITNNVDVCYLYKLGTRKYPFIGIQSLSSSSNKETYDEGEVITNCPIQLVVYSKTLKIQGISTNAQDSTLIIADKIMNWFNAITLSNWNNNIIRVRKSGSAFPTPVESGETTPFSLPIRYDFDIVTDYTKIY